MPFDFAWYDDKHTIVLVKVTEPFDWDDYADHFKEMIARGEAQGVTQPVAIITDWSQVNTNQIPSNPLANWTRLTEYMEHPSFEIKINIGARSMFFQQILKIFDRLYGHGRILVADTLEEALEIVHQKRAGA